jgi:hypothetical protein
MVPAMDPLRPSPSCRAHDYSQLTDQELSEAIDFVANRARCLNDDHTALHQLYSAEASTLRHQLVERALARLFASGPLLTPDRARALGDLVVERRIGALRLARLIRTATNGRTADVAELTEIEAAALVLRLGREP